MTFNKDTKTPGGTTGFSTNFEAVKRWEINASYLAALRTCFHQHLNYQQQNYKHQDLTPSRINRDNTDISSILQILSEVFINPFSDFPLVCISTGIIASENVSRDLDDCKRRRDKVYDEIHF